MNTINTIKILSTTEAKRKLLKSVFSTVKLDGQKLVYTLRPPFDAFVKPGKNGKRRVPADRFRQIHDLRIAIIYLPQEIITI